MCGLTIGDLNIERAIVQGGMGVGISLASLAGTVAREGGLGLISSAQIGFREPDFYKRAKTANLRAMETELKKAREIAGESARGAIGFNIMVATKGYEDYVRTAVAHGADIIVSGAGLPIDLPELITKGMQDRLSMARDRIHHICRDFVTKIAPIVSSIKSAKVILKFWDRKYASTADMVVIESALAGGHLGFSLEDIDNLHADNIDEYDYDVYDEEVRGILSEVKRYEDKYGKHIPVVFGGGIYSADDVRHALSLGVDGVQVGTRFVTTEECDAPYEYKKAYIAANKEDVVITKSPVGMPGRAVLNSFLSKLKLGRIPIRHCHDCLAKCDKLSIPYCITEALIAAATGDMEHALVFTGANVWKSNKIETVREVMNELDVG